MIVIKRNGQEAKYERDKIFKAIDKAVQEVTHGKGNDALPNAVSSRLDEKYKQCRHAISVEEIQDDVETELMKEQAYDVAKAYIRYRHEHELMRKRNLLDGKILSIVDGVNEEVIQENSNKNPMIASTQRDYIAGEVSRDISNRVLLPEDIRKAHEEGIIHFHDSDYFIQRILNCCLVNLEDMLQNGTTISNTMIEKPHSFSTACNVATQIIAQVASNQYGGQTISLTHLAPFVDVSRQMILDEVLSEWDMSREEYEQNKNLLIKDLRFYKIKNIVENRLRKEIEKGIQTIQYQVLTLMTTNGQTPFITVFMYLNEAKDEQTKNDLAMIIEETVRQRYKGVKNEKGVWITPAFPKLIYVLEEDNIIEDGKYWYLTELCAKCSAKRLVPDYISEKIMLENKIDKNGKGNCFPCINKACA